MPVAIVIGIVAEAVGAAVGIELTAAAIGEAVIGTFVGEAVAEAVIESTVLADVIGGAIYGAGTGALSAAITGGDIGQGALMGAISGGVGGGIGDFVSDAVTGAIGEGAISTGISSFITSEVSGTVAGVATGQDLGEAASGSLLGAIGSGAFAASGLGAKFKESIGKIINPTDGGTDSGISGWGQKLSGFLETTDANGNNIQVPQFEASYIDPDVPVERAQNASGTLTQEQYDALLSSGEIPEGQTFDEAASQRQYEADAQRQTITDTVNTAYDKAFNEAIDGGLGSEQAKAAAKSAADQAYLDVTGTKSSQVESNLTNKQIADLISGRPAELLSNNGYSMISVQLTPEQIAALNQTPPSEIAARAEQLAQQNAAASFAEENSRVQAAQKQFNTEIASGKLVGPAADKAFNELSKKLSAIHAEYTSAPAASAPAPEAPAPTVPETPAPAPAPAPSLVYADADAFAKQQAAIAEQQARLSGGTVIGKGDTSTTPPTNPYANNTGAFGQNLAQLWDTLNNAGMIDPATGNAYPPDHVYPDIVTRPVTTTPVAPTPGQFDGTYIPPDPTYIPPTTPDPLPDTSGMLLDPNDPPQAPFFEEPPEALTRAERDALAQKQWTEAGNPGTPWDTNAIPPISEDTYDKLKLQNDEAALLLDDIQKGLDNNATPGTTPDAGSTPAVAPDNNPYPSANIPVAAVTQPPVPSGQTPTQTPTDINPTGASFLYGFGNQPRRAPQALPLSAYIQSPITPPTATAPTDFSGYSYPTTPTVVSGNIPFPPRRKEDSAVPTAQDLYPLFDTSI